MNDFWFAAAWSNPRFPPFLHGGAGDGGGGGVAGVIEALLGKITALIDSGAAFAFFPGIRAMAINIHPMVVHFPVAFLTGFLLLDVIGVVFRVQSLRQVAGWMLYLGTVGAMGAAVAGLIAAANVPHGEAVHEIMEWHERAMLTVAALALVLAVWRAAVGGRFGSAMAQGLHLVLAGLMVSLMVVGADLGGLMVYRHGVGVASPQRNEEASQHSHPAGAGRILDEAAAVRLPQPDGRTGNQH